MVIIAMCQAFYAQDLVDKYKTGSVTLVPDMEYAVDNDWNTVFRSYNDTLYGKPMADRKSIVITPNGSVVVNHRYRKYHTQFTPDGTFEKELLIEKGDDEAIKGIINGNTYFTDVDKVGHMVCSDLNGNYKQTITLDYKAQEIIALPNGNLAVVGWAIWKEAFRTFVSIVDYDTNEENVIWDNLANRPKATKQGKLVTNPSLYNYRMQLDRNGRNMWASITTMPYSKLTRSSGKASISCIGNKIFIALPSTGEIFIYDLDGNKISNEKIDWANNYISIEEQTKIQNKAIEKYTKKLNSDKIQANEVNKAAYENLIEEMKQDLTKIVNPIAKPYFATVIKDSDDNLLFFEMPEKKNANRFNVWIYKEEGSFICKSTFVCDDYELNINPAKMVFHEGYIYGLFVKKNVSGVPLRIARFKLQ